MFNSLILQWKRCFASSTNHTVTFPIAFKSWYVVAGLWEGDSDWQQGCHIKITGRNLGNFTAYFRNNDKTFYNDFILVGY